MTKYKRQDIPVVILCGGRGTRISESNERRPKGLMEVGGMPIIWHIMKIFSFYGFHHFILCLGYGAKMYKEYFTHLRWLNSNFRLSLNSGNIEILDKQPLEDWTIDFIDTGANSETGERLRRVKKYIHSDNFFVSYADDLINCNLAQVFKLHQKEGRTGTLVACQVSSPFGVLDINKNKVRRFREKPKMPDWINAGFYVFNKEIFDYLKKGKILEREPLEALTKKGQLSVYPHKGFMVSINSQKELILTNKMWYSGEKIPWKVW